MQGGVQDTVHLPRHGIPCCFRLGFHPAAFCGRGAGGGAVGARGERAGKGRKGRASTRTQYTHSENSPMPLGSGPPPVGGRPSAECLRRPGRQPH